MADQLLALALRYAELGWAVLPLRGKIPAIAKEQGGSGYNDATKDPDCIKWLWRNYPGANVGIATRVSRLLVLDIDPRHGGEDRLSELAAKHGPLPISPSVTTGGGGRHIYLRAPRQDEITRKANAVGGGIDLPNYVVAPPSIHPETGKAYSWGSMSSPFQVEISEIPPWLLVLLKRNPGRREILIKSSPPGWLGLVYSAIVTSIEAGGGRIKSEAGGVKVQCPFHDDIKPSLSIHPEKGWICFAGCGEGRLTSLAVKLGVSVL